MYLWLSVDTTVTLFKSYYKLVIDAVIKPCLKLPVCLSIITLKKNRDFKQPSVSQLFFELPWKTANIGNPKQHFLREVDLLQK